MVVAFQCSDLGVVLDRDPRVSLEAAGEIARHRGSERGTPHQHTDAPRIAAQKHRGLAGRIAAADDYGLGVLTIPGFHVGGRIVHARALEIGESIQRKPPILHPARDYDCTGTHTLAILEGYAEGTVLLRLERRDSARYRKSGAELHGLHLATPHEVRARDAGWKTQVVLDSARRSRLTSQNDVLDDQRAQTLGASVNGRRHAGRPPADDQHIEMLVAAEVDVEPEEPRDLIRRRIRDRYFAAEDNRRGSGIDCATLSRCLGFRAVEGD